jgi:hypothetical protein
MLLKKGEKHQMSDILAISGRDQVAFEGNNIAIRSLI